MTESKLSGKQISALMAQGFWPLEVARIMPHSNLMLMIDIEGERWVKRCYPPYDFERSKAVAMLASGETTKPE